MDDIKIGEEYWTWIKPHNRNDMCAVKKIVIKDIFTVMVAADIPGSGFSIDIDKDRLYSTQQEAIEALQKNIDGEIK